jgi:antitoxin HicB
MDKTGRVEVRIPLHFEPQPEGGYTVTSPLLPELLTEGDTVEEAMDNVEDAFEVVLQIYEDEQRELPAALFVPADMPFESERLLAVG